MSFFKFAGCLFFLILSFELILNKPIPDSEDNSIYIESHFNNLRKRFGILSKQVDGKYSEDLNELIKRLDEASGSLNFEAINDLIENYATKLKPDFADYLQLQLDLQLLNEDINVEIWFLKELQSQVDPELAQDIENVFPFYEQAKKAEGIEEKYDIFADIDSHTSKRLMRYLEATPQPAAILNVHLRYFDEFLNYLLQENIVGEFQSDIKSLLRDVEKALEKKTPSEWKVKTLDRFDDVETKLGKFLDAKVHEFEIYKFTESVL